MPIWAPTLSTNKKSLSNNAYSCLGVEKTTVLIAQEPFFSGETGIY